MCWIFSKCASRLASDRARRSIRATPTPTAMRAFRLASLLALLPMLSVAQAPAPAAAPAPLILYVATGEANNRQTTSYGDGLYKSTDAGKTFTNIGFKNAQTLGRVIVHPRDPNTVWIAVGGHLYGPNAERGVFMTADGGKTWAKTLYVDEYTSA